MRIILLLKYALYKKVLSHMLASRFLMLINCYLELRLALRDEQLSKFKNFIIRFNKMIIINRLTADESD